MKENSIAKSRNLITDKRAFYCIYRLCNFNKCGFSPPGSSKSEALGSAWQQGSVFGLWIQGSSRKSLHRNLSKCFRSFNLCQEQASPQSHLWSWEELRALRLVAKNL